MPGPFPYVLFPGCAREALDFYGEIFGGSVTTHRYADFGRRDGPADAVAHGQLDDGPVRLYGADAGADDVPFGATGLMFSLLGAASPATSRGWFEALADGGTVVDDLQARAWGAEDGQVIDRFGIRWLIGYQVSDAG